MEIKGKIIAVLPLATGEGRNGPWRAQDYVLETIGSYPRKVCFNLFGEKVDQYPLALDDVVTVSFDIESREWNGRWFTTIRAWRVEKEAQQQPAAPVGNLEPFDGAAAPEDDGSGLPF